VNGPHDLGGAHGFGPVVPEADEPVFHAEWEGRSLALLLAMGATRAWNLDQMRFARERTPPAEYLASSYYEIWAGGLARLLVERGLATADELASGHAGGAPRPIARTLAPGDVWTMLTSSGGSTRRPSTTSATFAIGERVRARVMNPLGHTRLPRYVRGRTGTVESVHGCHVYPDVHARVPGDEDPQWLYTVVFDGRELWGADADPTVTVSVDAFEPYLEPA
jgi:nitrile hydratase subunit beta